VDCLLLARHGRTLWNCTESATDASPLKI